MTNPTPVEKAVKKELAKTSPSWIRRDWLVVGVLFVFMSVLTFGITKMNESLEQTKALNEQNNRFLNNFSNYMRCLVVNEDEVVIALGEEAYVNLCDDLLFRGVDSSKREKIIVTIPPVSTSSTSSTTTKTTF